MSSLPTARHTTRLYFSSNTAMSQHPTGTTFQPQPHKIKIPRTAASYTPATMDNDLRSQLNVQLLHNGHDKK